MHTFFRVAFPRYHRSTVLSAQAGDVYTKYGSRTHLSYQCELASTTSQWYGIEWTPTTPPEVAARPTLSRIPVIANWLDSSHHTLVGPT